MADQEDDANKPPEVDAPDPNPEKIEAANITFEGQEVVGKGDLFVELVDIALEKLEGQFNIEDEEVARNRRAALLEAVADIDEFRAEGGEGALHLALDEAGNLVNLNPDPPVPVEPAEEPDFQDHDAEMDAPANPEDPGGDSAGADPDPLVSGRIIEMPSSKNGADAYCKLLDAASASYSEFSDALKQAIEDDAFTTDESPYPPLYNGGDWLAIHDKNGKFVLIYLMSFDGKYQTELTAFDPDITSCTVSAKHLGLATDADVTLLLIPMYNEAAGGCGDVCGDTLPFELHPQDGLYKWGYHYNAPSSGGSWSDGERAGGAARNETFNIVNDATGISLGTCGFTIRMVEYVSTASSICLHRLLTFDKCGTLTGVSASIESELS